MIVTFPNFTQAVTAGHAIALADGIVKKLVTPLIWSIPEAAGVRPA